MSRIVVFGAAGKAGSASSPRPPPAATRSPPWLTVGGPDAGLYAGAVAAAAVAVGALGPAGPRIIHMGGGASLLNDDGVRFFDAPGFPEEFKPYAIGQIRALDAYLALDDSVTWTYLSPPPVHFAPRRAHRPRSHRSRPPRRGAGRPGPHR
ncbi:hypothetical protein [Streptomyces sp. ME19-01-6]|uniref:hypothetical protein n=1 Tax=Streptomyces sp. ME19-01-6 TaxID=3028686 RepID=UPI0029AE491C|nr:hypothetical protein [Streptomyces sp. ME19-01-6]MDX3227827.1 hypothetical protein [Streptomyces sp. ME19-01-6]